MSAFDINNMIEQAPIELPPALILVDVAELLAMELPTRELLLSPWLPKAGLCMIHAYRGIGKTHLSLGVAHAVAKGGEFLGWKSETPRNVLFVDGEMPAAALQERLARIITMSGESTLPGQLKIITPDLQHDGMMPDIGTLEGQHLLNQFIPENVDLIILDNISCLAPSIKENDATDWALIQTWVLRQRSKGRSVLLIHHSGKSGLQRGTSKKEDVVDTVITLERPKDYDSNQGARFLVKYEKTRGFFGDDARPFEAHLIDHEGKSSWQIKTSEESTYEQVYSLRNDGLSPKEISLELGVHKSTVSRHLTRARNEGVLCQGD
jgi:DNA-binding CsgD family transcriptional regulator